VTELAQQSLKDFVSNKRSAKAPPSKETIRNIAKAIVMVMAGLHAKGLVHMDVKPENLMVFDGCLKLIDVDGCVEIGSKVHLNDPSISFSPIYCAPEWASFLLDRDHKACIDAAPGLDAWSVGCTLCELVTLESVLRPQYNNLTRRDRRSGLAKYMDWLGSLQETPIPNAVNELDGELGDVMASLLTCNKKRRSSCASILSAPCFATDRVQRTKSSPLTCEVYGFANESDTDSTSDSDGNAACSSQSSHMSEEF
jgi:serine/threonine protein kinase